MRKKREGEIVNGENGGCWEPDGSAMAVRRFGGRGAQASSDRSSPDGGWARGREAAPGTVNRTEVCCRDAEVERCRTVQCARIKQVA